MTKPVILVDIESAFSSPYSTEITKILNNSHENGMEIKLIASTFGCKDRDREERVLNASNINPDIIENVIGIFSIDDDILANVVAIVDEDKNNPIVERTIQKSKNNAQHFFPSQPEELTQHLGIATPTPPVINPPA